MHSPDHSTKGTPSALPDPSKRARAASDCLGVRGFRVCFIPLAGCFSPFPHGTAPLSVAEGVEPWRVVPPASHKLTGVRGTQDANPTFPTSRYGSLTPSARAFQHVRVVSLVVMVGPTTPVLPQYDWFGLFPSRSPLLRESRLISFRAATEMFQFAACPSSDYAFL
jgi:hypothetical protein